MKWVYKKERGGFIKYLRFEMRVQVRRRVMKNLNGGGRNRELGAGEEVNITWWIRLCGRV